MRPRPAPPRARGRALALLAGVLVGLSGSEAGAEDEVRIALLSGADVAEVRGRGLALFDARDGRRVWAFRGRGTATLLPTGGGVEARGAGPAQGRSYGKARGFIVEAEGAVQVGEGVYYGRLEVTPSEEGGLFVMNRLPLETYLLGIVGSEMPASWPTEALKAQAVAARTFALQRLMMARSADQPHDLGATVLSQVYRGAERIQSSVVEAVRSTRGEVLTHDWMLVEALFHSTCGGETVASETYFGGVRPYLVARPCRWCQGSRLHRWETRLPRPKVEERLRTEGLLRGALRGIERRDPQDPVRIRTDRGEVKLDARRFRRALGWSELYSERFLARTSGSLIVFEGRGFGHGVGMCQWGAKGMAEEGRTYREILAHYYAGARVKRAY